MNTTDAAVNDGFIYPTDGMSIRDHFAGLAMQSIIIANHPDGSAIEWSDTAMVDAIRQQSRDIEQLRAELNRERETNAGLRRDLADPPPDIQELALKKCGHFEIVAKLRADLAAAVAERDRLRRSEVGLINSLSDSHNARFKLEARLSAIDSAPVVAVASEIMSHLGSYRSLHAIPGRMPEDGTELIARPEKE